jgi:hypothetical protein
MTQETLYDIIDENGDRVYKEFAYDLQCDTYYGIHDMTMIRGDRIIDHNWTVIEAGYYTDGAA